MIPSWFRAIFVRQEKAEAHPSRRWYSKRLGIHSDVAHSGWRTERDECEEIS